MSERAKVTVYIVTHEHDGYDAAGRTCRLRSDHAKFFVFEHANAHAADVSERLNDVRIEPREEYEDEQHHSHMPLFVRVQAG